MSLRVGLIGLGVISRFYIAAFDDVDDVELVAVCDIRPDVLTPFENRCATYRDHADLLASGLLDAVVVNVPNDLHGPICADALAAGLHVCVEKPLAVDLATGTSLVDLARASGLTLFTSFHRRYNNNVLGLHALVTSGTVAAISSVTVRYKERIEDHVGADDWYLDTKRCGGGCVADNGPNAFDVARMFVPDLEFVSAMIRRDENDVDLAADILLRGDCGRTALVQLDWAYAGEQKDVTVELTDGSVHSADMLDGYHQFKESLWHEYIGVLDAFASNVKRLHLSGNATTVIDDGLRALSLVTDVYRSRALA